MHQLGSYNRADMHIKIDILAVRLHLELQKNVAVFIDRYIPEPTGSDLIATVNCHSRFSLS